MLKVGLAGGGSRGLGLAFLKLRSRPFARGEGLGGLVDFDCYLDVEP